MMEESVKTQTQELQCETKSLTGVEPVKVTVGEVFQIECLNQNISFNPSQIRLKVQSESKDGKKNDDLYALKILKSDYSPQGKWVLQVVSYRVGSADKLSIEITDGINTLPINGVKFQVESVIDPKDPPKGPIGPFGPFMMEFPWGGVLILSSILLVIIAGIVIKFLRIVQKRKIIERMKKYDSAQLPVAQFYAEMRKLEREIDLLFEGKIESTIAVAFMKRSEDALKLFLLRQFQVPTFEWSNKMVLKDFKSRYLWFGEEMHNQLSVLIRELEKSQKNDVVISLHDVHQLLKNLKRWVDRASYMADKLNLKMRET